VDLKRKFGFQQVQDVMRHNCSDQIIAWPNAERAEMKVVSRKKSEKHGSSVSLKRAKNAHLLPSSDIPRSADKKSIEIKITPSPIQTNSPTIVLTVGRIRASRLLRGCVGRAMQKPVALNLVLKILASATASYFHWKKSNKAL